MNKNSFKSVFSEIANGLKVSGYLIKAEYFKAKFPHQMAFRIFVSNVKPEVLMFGLISPGKPGHNPFWIELYGIKPKLNLDGRIIAYFGSQLEVGLLRYFSRKIPPGGRFFVEYLNDWETRFVLERGVPPVLTRLGFKLFKLGFFWFKDWYFPEGFWEGSQKLQVEKPLNEEHLLRQKNKLKNELIEFLETKLVADMPHEDEFLVAINKRAFKVFKVLEN